MSDQKASAELRQLAKTYQRLRKIREKTDLALKPNPYLKSTFTDFDGEELPFKLRYYQVQMVCHLLLMDRFVVGDDMGLGKTAEVIAALSCVFTQTPGEKVIVLTNKNAVLQWVDEFAKFTKGVNVRACYGSPTKRKKVREWFVQPRDEPTVMVMNYRLAVQDFGQIQGWHGYTLVSDEATAYKSPNTLIHRVCAHLSKNAHRHWAMTGTLIKNNLIEGYGIYKVVMPGLFQMSRSAFMENYCITRLQPIANGRHVPVIVGYRQHDIQRFKTEIDPFYLGRPKHKVATELPTLQKRIVKLPMTKFQEQKYLEALDGFLEMGDGEIRETTKLTAITYCQEIANHPELIDCEGESEKVKYLKEALTEGGELHGEKVIIFSRFERMVSVLEREMKGWGLKTVRVTGKEGDDERAASRKAFQDAKSGVDVIFITMAGGDAINLQAAKAIVFYDTPWSAGDYLQILGRMIRIGSKHDRVFAIHLLTLPPRRINQSVDQRTLKVNKDKMALVEAVIGKRIKGEDAEVPEEIMVTNPLDDLFQGMLEDARDARK